MEVVVVVVVVVVAAVVVAEGGLLHFAGEVGAGAVDTVMAGA